MWRLRLTGVLAVPGIQSAPLTRCPGPLKPSFLTGFNVSVAEAGAALAINRKRRVWKDAYGRVDLIAELVGRKSEVRRD